MPEVDVVFTGGGVDVVGSVVIPKGVVRSMEFADVVLGSGVEVNAALVLEVDFVSGESGVEAENDVESSVVVPGGVVGSLKFADVVLHNGVEVNAAVVLEVEVKRELELEG